MSLIIFLGLLIFLAAAQANENSYPGGDQIETDDSNSKDEQEAFESLNSPVYGASKSEGLPPIGKSGYALPPPSSLPASYNAYLTSLGYASPFGYGNAYNRYGMMPYASPYYSYGAYGSPYTSAGYGYGPGVASGYGFPAGLPYGNPILGRTAYNPYGYGGYLGYPGLGYNSALRGPLVPSPVAGVPAPVPAVPAPVPGIAAYRAPVLPTQSKDGTLQYGYGPTAGQRLIGY